MDMETTSTDDMDSDQSFTDQKLEQLQSLTDDYTYRKSHSLLSFVQQGECLWQILDVLNLLKSDHLFIFSFGNNQIVNCFILKTLEILITSETKLRVRNDGLTLLVYLIESTIETRNGDLKFEYAKKWIGSSYAEYFNQLPIKLLCTIITENDLTLLPTTFNLIVFAALSSSCDRLFTSVYFSCFLSYLKRNADRCPQNYLKFINTLLSNLVISLQDGSELVAPEANNNIYCIRELVQSVFKLYDIYKHDTENKVQLNNTVYQLDFALKLILRQSRVFCREIPELCCQIYGFSFELCLEEIRSKDENLTNIISGTFVDCFGEKSYLSTTYIDSILRNVHRMLQHRAEDLEFLVFGWKTQQYVNHDFLQVLIKLLEIISSRSLMVPTATERSCLKLIGMIALRADINPDYLWTHFWEQLETHFIRLFKFNQKKRKIEIMDTIYDGNPLTGIVKYYVTRDYQPDFIRIYKIFLEAYKSLFKLKLEKESTVLSSHTFLTLVELNKVFDMNKLGMEEERIEIFKMQMRIVEAYTFEDFMKFALPAYSFVFKSRSMELFFLNKTELWSPDIEKVLQKIFKMFGQIKKKTCIYRISPADSLNFHEFISGMMNWYIPELVKLNLSGDYLLSIFEEVNFALDNNRESELMESIGSVVE